jgi:hypothetical protein
MDIPVRQHIELLERRLRELGAQLMSTKERSNLNDLEAEIRVANMALDHYREALKLESELQK